MRCTVGEEVGAGSIKPTVKETSKFNSEVKLFDVRATSALLRALKRGKRVTAEHVRHRIGEAWAVQPKLRF